MKEIMRLEEEETDQETQDWKKTIQETRDALKGLKYQPQQDSNQPRPTQPAP